MHYILMTLFFLVNTALAATINPLHAVNVTRDDRPSDPMIPTSHLVCGNFSTASHLDVDWVIGDLTRWPMTVANSCTTPARTCRRVGCENTSAVYVSPPPLPLPPRHPLTAEPTGLQRLGQGNRTPVRARRRRLGEPHLHGVLPQEGEGPVGADFQRPAGVQCGGCLWQLQPWLGFGPPGHGAARGSVGAEWCVQHMVLRGALLLSTLLLVGSGGDTGEGGWGDRF